MCQNIRWNPFKRWSEDGGGSHLEWSFKRGKMNMIRGLVCQKQVSTAGTSNCIPQYMWGVITCPSPWYLLLAYNFSFVKAVPRKHSSVSKTFPLLELAWGAEAYPATPLTTTDVIIEKQGSTKPYRYLKTLVQVSREWLSDYIPHFSVGCNYLSLPQIHVLSPKSSFMGCTVLTSSIPLGTDGITFSSDINLKSVSFWLRHIWKWMGMSDRKYALKANSTPFARMMSLMRKMAPLVSTPLEEAWIGLPSRSIPVPRKKRRINLLRRRIHELTGETCDQENREQPITIALVLNTHLSYPIEA